MLDKPVLLSQSHDILTDIMTPVSHRNITNTAVFFQRYIGFDNENNFNKLINDLNNKLSTYGDSYLVFSQKIPTIFEKQIIDNFEVILKKANPTTSSTSSLADILSGSLQTGALKNSSLDLRIRQALEKIIDLYKSNEITLNVSIFSNFIIKQLYWINLYIPVLFKTVGDINPKVTYYGNIKKHEAYFFILLSLIGCDVLIFNSLGDGDYSAVDKADKYSEAIYGALKKETNYPSKIVAPPVINRANTVATDTVIGKNVDQMESLLVLMKKSNDILIDFVLPLSERVGYAGKPSPIIPVFFYRYVGIPGDSEEAKDDYFNSLFLLDRKLKTSKNGYVKAENQLVVPTTEELFELQDIECKVGTINELYMDNVLFSVLKSGKLVRTGYELLDNAIIKALKTVLLLYLNKEKTTNPSKLKNFVYKIVFWINKYVRALYRNLDFSEAPKFLYYGEIKLHEVYLLIALSLIGCDIIYISPDIRHGIAFKQLDANENFSVLVENMFTLEFENFPTSEKAVRQSTVAYKASEQIEEMIYGADTGLFKPWQFENYNTMPLCLKTTFDELKLLWNEPSKMRQGFKIENKSVYIPNLFAKINGVNEDINDYWKALAELSFAKNCLTISKVPFTDVIYSNQEMYSCAYLFDKNGFPIRENVLGSKFYKFGYLKTSLQQLIFNKINELMISSTFIKKVDDKFKLKILMTILTLDVKVLNLLDAFDFSSDIPKLLIYLNDTNQFSDEDAIILGFLNLIGLDIAIFTPTNYNNIENHFKYGCFDTFQLPSVNLQLNMPDLSHWAIQNGSRSFFSKIFNK
jgi:hypothetical protein